MSEDIVEVDPRDGRPIGVVARDVAHQTGRWHASIHVWLLLRDGRVVLQRRSPEKDLFPSMWDISAAGHLRPGEDGLREVAEELGVYPHTDELTDLGLVSVQAVVGELRNNEWCRVHVWRSGLELRDLSFPDGEVTAVGALPASEFATLTTGGRVQIEHWSGRTLGRAAVAGEELVPLPAHYWSALLPALTALAVTPPPVR